MSVLQWALLIVGAIGWYGGVVVREAWWGNEALGKGLFALGVIAFAGMIASLAIDPPNVGSGSGGDCYVDWDGRSNPTVCD